MIHSLRWRVMLGTAGLTAVFLVAAGVAMMLLLKQSLLKQLDTHLDSAGQSLTTAFESHDEKPHIEWEGIGDGPPIIFRAWDSNGKILTQSSLPVSMADEKRPQLIGDGSQTGDALLSDGSLGRYLLLSFIPHLEGGHEHEDEDDDNHRDEQSALMQRIPKPPHRGFISKSLLPSLKFTT